MSRIGRLLENYRSFIAVPWTPDAPAPQRVVFCVYPETEERALRLKVGEFELATVGAGHGWALYDLTDAFARWMGGQRYARRYFERPELLRTVLPRFPEHIEAEFRAFLQESGVGPNTVVALLGVGGLFGFCRVKEVVERFAPHVPGRLVVFFPGSYEANNYRLLDSYDGWDYQAVPITADRIHRTR